MALFRDAPGLVGRLIRWQTRSEYSHAALVFDRTAVSEIDGTAQLFKEQEAALSSLYHTLTHRFLTIEAREFRGVRMTEGVVKAAAGAVDLFSVNSPQGAQRSTEEALGKVWFFAKEQIDKGYDYTMVARFVSRRQEQRSSSDKWFCSELVFAALQKAGIDLLRDVEPWAVSPGLLAKSPLLKWEKTI